MRTHPSPAFRLTADLVARHGGEQVLCLAHSGIGHRWPLYPERPGAGFVTQVEPDIYRVTAPVAPAVEPPTMVLRVDIRGPIEETSGYADECGAWSDGNDAITERLCAAFVEGDVLLCIHSPGGNPSGAPEGMRRALEAKAANGRRCIMHCEGMAASLGFWWGAVLADEIYISADARLGSIGARGSHGSIAGALAIEGVVVTYSVWPDEGKIAGAPELPQSPVGKARNDRDVALIGMAFANAVASSPIGMRTGLTVDVIRSLPGAIGGADVLTGVAAVAAGLADGIATLEETAAWALESAGTGPGETMTIKAADDKPPEKDKDDEETDRTKAPGMQPETACKSCQMENRPEAKFCDQCGASMAAEPMEKNEETPASSKKPGAMVTRAPVRPVALASIPALRTSLSRSETLLAAVAQMVGARSHAEILGAIEATVADAGKAKRYREERDKARVTSDSRERMDLLASLYTADPKGHPRGKLVVDVVEDAKDASGKVTGARVVGMRPAAQWGDGADGRTLPNLRAYTRSTLAGLPASEVNPFDRAPHGADEAAAAERVSAAHVEQAKGQPAVKMATDDGIDPAVAAEIYARRFGPQNAGVPS